MAQSLGASPAPRNARFTNKALHHPVSGRPGHPPDRAGRLALFGDFFQQFYETFRHGNRPEYARFTAFQSFNDDTLLRRVNGQGRQLQRL